MDCITKVLVTGANGFIGSNLCKNLASKKFFVRAMALPGTSVENIAPFVHEIIFADITKPETLEKPLDGITHVFHLAALASDWGSLDFHMKVNAEGTRSMLNASVKKNVKRFLHVSSLAVHKLNGHEGSDETTTLDGNINAYAISKRKAEEIVKDFSAKKKIETVIVRPGFFPYGPGDTTSFLHLANAISEGKYANINGGKVKVSVSFIDNLTEGMILCAMHPKAANEIFILSDDEALLWIQIAEDIAVALTCREKFYNIPYKIAFCAAWCCELIWKFFGKKTAPPITRYRVAVPRKNLIFSNEKAKNTLGYNPTVKWKEGLEKTIKWYSDYISKKSSGNK